MGTEFLKKIGNILAVILLGETKDKIIEISKDVEYIRKEMDEDIKPILKNVDKKVAILWAERFATRHSPIQLNQRGKEILEKSGIKTLIDEMRTQFFTSIKEKTPQNAYQVQELSKQVVFNIKNDPKILPQLEKSAYNIGVDVDSILWVGSIYLRDLVLPDFKFRTEQIDNQ